MQWQDLVFAGGVIIMALALVPTLLGKDKPALSTSTITATIMLIFTATYITLGFIFSTITAFINCGLWITLAIQKYRQTKKST